MFLSIISLDIAEHLLGIDQIEICIEEESDNKEDTVEKELDKKLFRSFGSLFNYQDIPDRHCYHYTLLAEEHIPNIPSPPPDFIS